MTFTGLNKLFPLAVLLLLASVLASPFSGKSALGVSPSEFDISLAKTSSNQLNVLENFLELRRVALGCCVGADKTPNLDAPGKLPNNGTNYDTVSTASSRQATAPRNIMEQSSWNNVVENPSAGRKIDGLNTDSRFLSEDGFQKMEATALSQNGQRVTIHYQYNSITGKSYDIKIVYPLNP